MDKDTQEIQEVKEKLEATYSGNQKEIHDICNYVGFGILIAIFFMGAKFRIRNLVLVFSSSLFAVISLGLNYYLSARIVKASGDMIQDDCQTDLVMRYMDMWNNANDLFWPMQGILVLAVVLFCILGIQYFLDPDTDIERSGTKIKQKK